jgi:hypothetical protein
MFYSGTFPQIIQSLSLSKGKMLSGFAIGHPGQRRVPHLVKNKDETQEIADGSGPVQ